MNNIPLIEKKCLYFLINNDLLGNATIRKLKKHFGSYTAIFQADLKEIKSLISDKMYEKYEYERLHRDINADFEKLIRKKIQLVCFEDNDFPEKLRHIPNPPVALLVNGKLPNPSIPSVAIIGARNCSNYGKYEAAEFSRHLAGRGIQIISGMASGIDGIAGTAAIRSGGISFAVLGCGPDVCYPQSNRQLFDTLAETGGIISEYALGTSGLKWHFPIRNRIISGLSDAVLVIEAKEKSGTLITVDSALEQGKDVYALPGRVCDALSVGSNNLIRQGAGMLTTPEEFLEEFLGNLAIQNRISATIISDSIITSNQINDSKITGNKISDSKITGNRTTNSKITGNNKITDKEIVFSSPEEKTIYDNLDYNPQSLDEISEAVNDIIPMPLPILMQRLTNLCIKGYAENISGTNYRRCR